jgi:hypothetical protein
MSSRQIITYGTNYSQEAIYPVTSRHSYICSNAAITRGLKDIPSSLTDCFNNFSGIVDIATQLGFITGANTSNGITSYTYTSWSGADIGGGTATFNASLPYDLYFEKNSSECESIVTDLGADWLGCLWGTPEASYSCICPNIKKNFEAYLKLRLNVATFWNTPKATPAKRAEFLDAIKYGKKIDFTVAGDFRLKVGMVAKIKVDGASGFPYSSSPSVLNGYYYIVGVKHVVTQGNHETALSLTKIPENIASVTGQEVFDSDYV